MRLSITLARRIVYKSTSGSPHFVESVVKKPAVLFVGVSSAIGLPTTINK